MKFLLLATLVVIASASTVYRSRNISVDDDGSVSITSSFGKRISILKQIDINGERNIFVTISGSNVPTRTIQLADNVSDRSQSDILNEILGEYQGVVAEGQYQNLMNKVNQAIRNGQISPQIYELLESIEQQGQGFYGQAAGYVQRQEQQYGQGQGQQYVQGQVQQYGQGQRFGYGSGYGFTGSSLPWWYARYPQSQYQQNQEYQQYQYPSGSYGNNVYNLGSEQYYGRSFNFNPFLARIFSTNQGGYISDLLANQQLNGGFLTRLGNQIAYTGVPQRILSSFLSRNQQVPYGQIRNVAFSSEVPQVYGTQQTYRQFSGIPQSTQQQQQIVQAIEQVNEIQQQQVASQIQQAIQQQQDPSQLNNLLQAVEQLNELQQQQEILEQVNEVQQQQQQYPVQQSWSQLFGIRQPFVQQQVGQYRSTPLSLRQLTGIPQTYGQSYYYNQPLYRSYRSGQSVTVQGTPSYFNTLPQPQLVY